MTNASNNPTLHTVKGAVIAVLGMLLLFLLPAPLYACDDWVAKVVSVEGSVQRQNPQQTQQKWQRLQHEQLICPGDSVRVGDNSRAALHLRNNTFARLDANSIISFPVHTREDRFWIELQQGLAHFISRIVHQFEVTTPYVNAVVEGTEFVVSARQQGAVNVVEGKVTAYNDKSRTTLLAGQQASAQARDQDLTRLNVPSATVVEWAIHYPPILTLAELPADSAADKDLLQQAMQALHNNRIDLALQLLASDNQSATIQLARAALLLQVGRMDEFDTLIATQLQGAQSGAAYGLQSIAAIARNRIDEGKTSANDAVKRAPGLAASWIALSYAQQAELQLNEARDSAHKAVKVQPDSVLAHLRLSELYLAQGDIDGARNALENLPDTIANSAALEGSKGFVQLFRLKLDSAKAHFKKALAVDSGNPQHHLGMGLALLRGGDLEKGRLEMEYAVSLDPLRSVLRSYVGRAYFEEKRDKEAVKQWDLAKQFDPNDPTPYFYTGVYKLFANDPVGAIDELETSRDLNDKRAIYRSETLLQSDAASRSATIARAYDEVGYDQGVLLNGWDAIRRDPTSSEGHRLLADYYADDPRYETARASELLQSQLWQPLSAYPLQPQLSESNLSVVAGAGPQRPGFNEYHSLFTQDGVYGMANGYGGSDGTWGDDLVGSFLAGPVAVSLGQYHYESDGWRENADQEQDIYNGFVQWQATQKLQLQLEARKFSWDKGDVEYQSDLIAEEENRSQYERETYRIGARYSHSEDSVLLLSAITQNIDDARSDVLGEETEIQAKSDSSPDVFEWQFVVRGGSRSLVVGGGFFDQKKTINAELSSFGMALFSQSDREEKNHANIYAYYAENFLQTVTLFAGVGYDRDRLELDTALDGLLLPSRQPDSKDVWSPKIGFSWNFSDSWKLRVASFESLNRDISDVATLEPTQFNGFVQFYNDADRSDVKNYAAALDGQLAEGTAIGVQFSRRDVDFIVNEYGNETDYSRNEKGWSLYANQRIGRRLALDVSYNVDRFDNDLGREFFGEVIENRASRIPVTLQYFAGSLFVAGARVTYYRQQEDVQVEDPDTLEVNMVDNDNKEWISDLFFKIRLVCRCGDVVVGVNNIENSDVEMLSSDYSTLSYYPNRFYYGRVRLSF